MIAYEYNIRTNNLFVFDQAWYLSDIINRKYSNIVGSTGLGYDTDYNLTII